MEIKRSCNVCTKTYSTLEGLLRHERRCEGTAKFKCSYCNKLLSSKQNMKEHEFTHTGELPYSCKYPGCGMKFRQGSVLSAHKRVHCTIEKYINDDILTWLTDIFKDFKEKVYSINENDNKRVELPPIIGPQELRIIKSGSTINY